MWTRWMCVAAICLGFALQSEAGGLRRVSSAPLCDFMSRSIRLPPQRHGRGTRELRTRSRSGPALSEEIAGAGGHQRQYDGSLTARTSNSDERPPGAAKSRYR